MGRSLSGMGLGCRGGVFRAIHHFERGRCRVWNSRALLLSARDWGTTKRHFLRQLGRLALQLCDPASTFPEHVLPIFLS